jgi:hypothetical protein
LPGKALVVFDPRLGLAVDVFPCEDGHAQERSLLSAVAATIQARDVYVMDRNFCVLEFLFNLRFKNGRNQSSAGEPAGWAGAKKVVGTLPGGPGRE